MSVSSVPYGGHAPPFTLAQWAEMEHQALIFKYLKAGLPVPPDLLSPIRNSFNLISPDFLRHHPTLGYTYCGKKLDPEPGRCRRSDGKKWRCSKDAHPDSKYCERHMHRGRYRSRKLVESKSTSQSSSTVTPYSVIGSCTHSGSFQNNPLHSMVDTGGLCFGTNASQLKMEPVPYGTCGHGNRGRNGAEEHNFMSESSGCARRLGMESSVDSSWRVTVPQVGLKSELGNSSRLLNSSSRSQPPRTFQDIEPLTADAAITTRQQKQQYVGGEYGLPPGPLKHEQHSLQPLFDEWPESRDLGLHLNDHRSNNTLSNTSQVQSTSSNNAMAPSRFFSRSAAESPDGTLFTVQNIL